MIKLPDIFNYSDYRAYIKDWITYSRTQKTSNLSKIAKTMDVHTTYLAHILSGKKNLSFEQAAELSDYLGLTSLEKEYFFVLLQIDRAGTKKLREYWNEKKDAIMDERSKVRSRIGNYHELTADERAIFYSSWIYVAVFITTFIDGGQTLEQIAERFRISRSKTEDILNFLVSTGICIQENSVYKNGKSRTYIGNESPLVTKHHSNWRMQALQKMDTREPTELFFTSPMSISNEDFLKIREILSNSIQSTLEICSDSQPTELVCLNIDYFKIPKK